MVKVGTLNQTQRSIR